MLDGTGRDSRREVLTAVRRNSGRISDCRRRRPLCGFTLAAALLLGAEARAQDVTQDVPPPPLEKPAPAVKPSSELVYPVGELQLEYAYRVSDVPDLATLSQLSVPLVRTPEGFRAPAKDETRTEAVSLNRPA